jgi:hypothetical protein
MLNIMGQEPIEELEDEGLRRVYAVLKMSILHTGTEGSGLKREE